MSPFGGGPAVVVMLLSAAPLRPLLPSGVAIPLASCVPPLVLPGVPSLCAIPFGIYFPFSEHVRTHAGAPFNHAPGTTVISTLGPSDAFQIVDFDTGASYNKFY